MMKRILLALISCAIAGLVPQANALADTAEDAEAKRCISLGRISSTDVVDDYAILFYMRGGDVYVNQLPHRCAGLKARDSFMYRTSLSQLCDLDIITVLEKTGFGFMPGASCGLGRFYPLTREEARALKEMPPQRIEKEDVPTAEPEAVDGKE